jgi:dTDP-4-dehydrorhamnose reductase
MMEGSQKLLLVGSSGFFGQALKNALSGMFQVIPTHHRHPAFELSEKYNFLTDDIDVLLQKHQVDIVVVAANLERPSLYTDSAEFRKRVQVLVGACSQSRLIYISSDAVFDGETGNYGEEVEPSPTTAYGKHLVLFEETLRSNCPDHCIIRPSYLYGFSITGLDKRLSHTKTRLEAQENVEYFSDMYKSPLEVNHAAQAVSYLTQIGHQGIIHVGGARKSIFQFHSEAMLALGIPTELLLPTQMPRDGNFQRDTSLDTTLMVQLMRQPHKSIAQSLDGGTKGIICT